MGEPHASHNESFSGWLYEGAHWLNEGHASEALFRGSEWLYGVNDSLYSGFPRHDYHPYPQWWEDAPEQGFYPSNFVYPVAPITGPTGPLTLVTNLGFPERTDAELRVYLNGVEQTVTLAPRIELEDIPLGGFRYGLHLIVRKVDTGEVVQVLGGVGVVTLQPDRHILELVCQGDSLLLR
jgi:hypothetical protein